MEFFKFSSILNYPKVFLAFLLLGEPKVSESILHNSQDLNNLLNSTGPHCRRDAAVYGALNQRIIGMVFI